MKARQLFYNLPLNAVELLELDYGKQVREALYKVMKRHKSTKRIFKTKIVNGKIQVKRII